MPLSSGHHAILAKIVDPNGVCYRGVPLCYDFMKVVIRDRSNTIHMQQTQSINKLLGHYLFLVANHMATDTSSSTRIAHAYSHKADHAVPIYVSTVL